MNPLKAIGVVLAAVLLVFPVFAEDLTLHAGKVSLTKTKVLRLDNLRVVISHQAGVGTYSMSEFSEEEQLAILDALGLSATQYADKKNQAIQPDKVIADRQQPSEQIANRQTNSNVQSSITDEKAQKAQKLLELGLDCYQRGDSVEAVRYYRLAAEMGSAWGQNNLGCSYIAGDGVEKDAVLGAQWIQKAAVQGLPAAQSALGSCYSLGYGMETNLVEAARWYQKAAEQGDAPAQRQLAVMYADGYGVPKNTAKALAWARAAAAQGHPEAIQWLAKWDAMQTSQVDSNAKSTTGSAITQTKRIICPACKGSGRCNNCGGTGIKKGYISNEIGASCIYHMRSNHPTIYFCRYCNGLRYIQVPAVGSQGIQVAQNHENNQNHSSATRGTTGQQNVQRSTNVDGYRDFGHVNPWGKAGERVVGTYSARAEADRNLASLKQAFRDKKGMEGIVNAQMGAMEEQVINAGDAMMSVQRPPEYRIDYDTTRNVWLLIEQRF